MLRHAWPPLWSNLPRRHKVPALEHVASEVGVVYAHAAVHMAHLQGGGQQ
jgi:hypothetical protein